MPGPSAGRPGGGRCRGLQVPVPRRRRTRQLEVGMSEGQLSPSQSGGRGGRGDH
jgi:hypothetical protein